MQFEIGIDGGKKISVIVSRKVENANTIFAVEIAEYGFKKEYFLTKNLVEDQKLLLKEEERTFQVEILEKGPRGADLLVDDSRYLRAELKTALVTTSQSSAPTSVAEVGETVVSNFPARVVRVQAKQGDKLESGDVLMVVEAMKMEATIKVQKPCRVSEILVKEGDRIEKGRMLARLEF
jgi:biotin carboxyl carrier protein